MFESLQREHEGARIDQGREIVKTDGTRLGRMGPRGQIRRTPEKIPGGRVVRLFMVLPRFRAASSVSGRPIILRRPCTLPHVPSVPSAPGRPMTGGEAISKARFTDLTPSVVSISTTRE